MKALLLGAPVVLGVILGIWISALGVWVSAREEDHRQRLIERMRDARDIHESWAERLKDDDPHKLGGAVIPNKDMKALLGTPEWHEEWVRDYEMVIEFLEE